MTAGVVQADIEFIRDVTYGPKRSPAAAIIGQVAAKKNTSTRIRMLDAVVDIKIGTPDNIQNAISVHGTATFKMENRASEKITAIIAFPLGDRSYSHYQFRSFTVRHNGIGIPVFSGAGGYKMPWKVTSVDTQSKALPPTLPLSEKEIYARMWRGLPVANDTLMQVLFWEGNFPSKEIIEITVEYVLDVPLQPPSMKTKHRQGTRSARQLREDSISEKMSKTLNPKKLYAFFSYIIASGASWEGSIGREVVRIHLDPYWDHIDPRLFMRAQSGGVKEVPVQWWQPDPNDKGKAATIFERDNFEPTDEENLYFALEMPPAESIGVATMEPNGTLVLMMRAESDDGIMGDAEIKYPPDHPRYNEIIEHLGGIHAGGRKPIPPW